MRLGIIGLPGSGKSTVFQPLTESTPEQWAPQGPIIMTVQVPDERVDGLNELMKPQKTVYAHLEFLLPHGSTPYGKGRKDDETRWAEIRPCDALVHVVRNFHLPGDDPPSPGEDLQKLETEMVFADLVVVEKRIERIKLDAKRGKETSREELALLEACLKRLEDEKPLREDPQFSTTPLLRGYALLSAKPVLTVFNNDEDDEHLPQWAGPPSPSHTVVVRGALEKEIAELAPEDTAEFASAYHVQDSLAARVVRGSCDVLGLVSFFTVVNREVRCWLVPKNTKALEAAGVIHSDMQKGFIRAEVLPYDDLVTAGTYQQAKKEAKVRLEGKDYFVEDGDVVYFRFNV